jgi:competence protein ComEC
MSIVLRVDYGETSFLFTGDAEMMSEEMMLSDEMPLRADVLKVAHHGSRYSSSPEFLAVVKPEWAVISCGEGNAYGHPHEEVLQALSQTTVLRTDQLGTIVFHSDGVALSVEADMVTTADIEYIGNRKSMKFHRLECESVIDMAEKNKVPLSSKEDAIKMGFQPCGRCKP